METEQLERIEKKLDQLLALLKGGARAGATPPGNAGGEVASDADLDGPRGDPEVRFVPKRWSGADYKGRRYSECEAGFLDLLAEALEWFAQRDDESGSTDKNGTPRSKWGRLDASRARGWAARKRAQGGEGRAQPARAASPAPARPPRAPQPPADPHFGSEEDIPF